MTPQVGSIVTYRELERDWAAIISYAQESDKGTANLTVFGKTGESYRTAPYSAEPKEGHWTPKEKSKK